MNQILNSGNERDNLELFQYLNEMQMKESQFIFLEATNTCFSQCVNSFTMSNLDKKEKECITRCGARYMENYVRVGTRYAEENAIKQQEAMMGQQ